MNIPSELKYTKDHEWVRLEDDMIAYVGITDFAQSELGELVYVEVDTVGETINQGDVFGTVEAVKTTSDLYMPVSGEIMEFNNQLNETGGDNPGIINDDPYNDGWIVKIKITESTQLDGLLSASDYQALIA
jgi:glycine cleavage system H protein